MRNLEIWMRCECYDAGRERQRNVLAAVLSFINVRVEVYIGNIPVQNRTGGVDHAIGDLGTDSYSVASHNTQQSMESEKKKAKTYAMPLIRLMRPDSTKLSVFTCFTTGQMNWT